ncbi:hypothetical protein [Nocardioides bruguierae]|uniref:hypothetical protein n=1 Tax=Nocardioides bruguierae TaxID=2945102 RepID=UPI002021F8FE|nr:hypothetical protein [Nocardioides bruguierae]MCL8024810.1 hypothetical protein [Nocardioides bruguierae]
MNDRPTDPPVPAATRRGGWLLVAALAALAEGATLLVLGVLEARATAAERLELGVSTTIFFVGLGLVVVAAGVSLVVGRGWGRNPLVFVQALTLLMAWSLRSVEPVSAALVAAGGLGLAGLLHPSTRRYLDERGRARALARGEDPDAEEAEDAADGEDAGGEPRRA